MDIGTLLDKIHMEIAEKLGLSGVAVPFFICHTASGVRLRLPAPGDDRFDFRSDEETDDVIGEGETLDEALENAVSSYRKAASQMVRFFWISRQNTVQ